MRAARKFEGGKSSWGLKNFIAIDELRADGYVKNNKLKVLVHLEAGEVVRSK